MVSGKNKEPQCGVAQGTHSKKGCHRPSKGWKKVLDSPRLEPSRRGNHGTAADRSGGGSGEDKEHLKNSKKNPREKVNIGTKRPLKKKGKGEV